MNGPLKTAIGLLTKVTTKTLDTSDASSYAGRMEWERIIGQLFSGFMCKLYAVAFAVWMAYEAGSFIYATFTNVAKGFSQ